MATPALHLGMEGAVSAEILGSLFTFNFSEETEELVSCACIGALPADAKREEILCDFMQGNYAWAGTGGGILGLDAESGLLCLSRRFSPDREVAQGFIEKIAQQAGLAQYWQSRLAPKETISAAAVWV
jgi:hypothetical protein